MLSPARPWTGGPAARSARLRPRGDVRRGRTVRGRRVLRPRAHLAAADILPLVFYEGVWDNRLKHLATLPRAKSLGWLQVSDIAKVKETVGDTMAIIGGMRNSGLQAGTVEQVREETRRVCEIAGEGGGFVMCPSIGEMEGCRPDLVKVWVEETKAFAVH